MANIITLREEITFGKHSGLTGQQLMKSAEGTDYLRWIWNNTDIPMDANMVVALEAHGFISRDVKRRNSRDGGAVSMRPFSECLNDQMLQDAIRNAKRTSFTEGSDHVAETIAWMPALDERTSEICTSRPKLYSEELVGDKPCHLSRNVYPYVQQIGRGELAPPKPFLSKEDIIERFTKMLRKESKAVDELV